MGNQSSSHKGLLNDPSESLDKYSCRVTKNYDDSIQISPTSIKTQFGNRYLYFPLPKDYLKDEFSQIGLLFQNFSVIPNNTDSCLIIRNNTKPTRNKIDTTEYLEFGGLSEKGGKFSVRINQNNINKSLIVYSNSIEH